MNKTSCTNCNSYLGNIVVGDVLCKKCGHINVVRPNESIKLILKELYTPKNIAVTDHKLL